MPKASGSNCPYYLKMFGMADTSILLIMRSLMATYYTNGFTLKNNNKNETQKLVYFDML